MRITEHITTLLYRYECVVIPKFGAFLTQRKPAQIHETSQVFEPPQKTVSFNRQLKDNDGVLANYVAQVEGISYEQSLKNIYVFVENITETLDSQRQVQLNGIGRFFKQGDKILFQADLHSNYLLEAFGTTSFTSEKIGRKSASKEIGSSVKENSASKEIPITAARETKPDDDASTKPSYWKYAAVGVIAIGIGGLLTANWYSSKIETHNLAAQQKAETQIEQKIQEATFIMDAPLPEVTLNVSAKRGKYHIVAGAFRQKENAEKKLRELRNNGFPDAKYIGENRYGLHQVIYDSFENRRKALHELYRIKNNNNSGAWLFVKNL